MQIDELAIWRNGKSDVLLAIKITDEIQKKNE